MAIFYLVRHGEADYSEMLEKGCVYEGSIECLNGGYSKWIILKFDDETSLY